jgi:hypothetical protein
MPQILGRIFVATALCLSCTGCRFGNHLETASSSSSYQGYYATEHVEPEFSTNDPGGCQSVPVSSLPALLTTALTDPVAVLVSDRKTGQGHLVASDGSGYALPIIVSPQGDLEFEGATPVEAFWRDPACITQVQLVEEGRATQRGGMGKSPGGLPLSGRVGLTFHYLQVLDGDCAATMQAVLDCHEDVSLCGESTTEANAGMQAEIQNLFRPYIDAGAMTVQDIPTIRVLGLTARYE